MQVHIPALSSGSPCPARLRHSTPSNFLSDDLIIFLDPNVKPYPPTTWVARRIIIHIGTDITFARNMQYEGLELLLFFETRNSLGNPSVS